MCFLVHMPHPRRLQAISPILAQLQQACLHRFSFKHTSFCELQGCTMPGTAQQLNTLKHRHTGKVSSSQAC